MHLKYLVGHIFLKKTLKFMQKFEYIFNNFDEAIFKGIAARKRCVNYYSIDSMAQILAGVIPQL